MTKRSKRLLLLAATTGYQTRVLAETARAMGLDVVLATDRCRSLDDPWGDQAVPVKFDVAHEAGRLKELVADLPQLLSAKAWQEPFLSDCFSSSSFRFPTF